MTPSVDWPIRSPLRVRTQATPDRVAVRDPEQDVRLTYRDLAEAVDRTADALSARSAAWDDTPHDRPRVGYLLSPTAEFVTTLYALWELGWTAVGLHTDLTDGELARNAELAELDALVVGENHDAPEEDLSCPTVGMSSVVESSPETDPANPQPRWGPDETALVLFTSGTTGQPKGVRLTFTNLLAGATASAFRLGVDPNDRWLCCLPVSHMGGLAPAVRTVYYGTTLVVQRRFEATEATRCLDTEGITGVSLVPTQLKRLLDTDWTPPETLDTVLLGGAPATDDLLDRASDANVPVYPTYGMTETASQIATARPETVRQHRGSVGQPLQGTTVTVLASGEPAEPGTDGELVVDGPTVAPGYLDDAQTADAFGEYGFHTGDLGYRDRDGRLWVVGRVDDVINTGGELVSPAEVADVLSAQPRVADAAVVGVDDEEWGQRVVAVVVPADGADLDAESLREACREDLARHKVPKEIIFRESIPRTGSGTVERGAVRERFSD